MRPHGISCFRGCVAAADLRALLEYRQQLIDERIRIANRVQFELGGLRPGYQGQLPSLIGRHRVDTARRLRAERPAPGPS